MEDFLSGAEECMKRAVLCIVDNDESQLNALYPQLNDYKFALTNIHSGADNEDLKLILDDFMSDVTYLLEEIDQILSQSEAAARITNECLPRLATGGRSAIVIPEKEVKQLREIGLTWARIGRILNVSVKTLKRRREQGNLESTERASTITDDDLDSVIKEIISEHPASGYVYIWSSLKARKIFVTFKRVQERVKLIDPIGIFLRSRQKIKRRPYKVKGAQYLWHIDGNEKLVGWKFYVHGCVDGHSRKIIYLSLAHNKTASKVLDCFTNGVEVHGVPIRVRGDGGTENVLVEECMFECNENIENPFIVGRSVHNVRIERLWAEVNRVVSSKFKSIFIKLEEAGLLDEHSWSDLLCLSYIYFGRINRSLQNFVSSWNSHGLSSEKCFTPEQLWLISIIQQRLSGNYVEPENTSSSENAQSNEHASIIHKHLLDFLTELPIEQILWFELTAMEIVPDPLMQDNTDGINLYCLLRNTVHDLMQAPSN